MPVKRILSLIAVVLLLLTTLVACGASSETKTENAVSGDSDTANRAPQEGLSKTEETGQNPRPANQKLIRKVYIDAQTEDMDGLLSQVEQRITELGGYVESREIYNGTNRQTQKRTGDLTIRIPAEKLDQFVNQIQDVSNITSLRETTDDVTLAYVSTESRILALQTEETRLLELLAQAETMEDLLTIESRLTEVRTELEQVQSQLRVMDNQVNYGTVYLSIAEVEQVVQKKAESKNFFVRIGNGFVDSLVNLWFFIRELVFILLAYLPYWLFIGLGAFVTLRIVKKRKKQSAEPDKK